MNAGEGGDHGDAPVLVTGGCGFIGCNIANALAAGGRKVLVFDNMSREGAQENAQWLKRGHGEKIEIFAADIRHRNEVTRAVANASAVLHLAAQVAVTTSLDQPAADFEINGRGTLNVLEAVRQHNPRAPVVYASTNKVYGQLLAHAGFARHEQRYVPADPRLAGGVAECTPLDLYSPYGCSKGTADQYVHDYARVYGLRTAVLRMSCIYGPRQFGTEDQGWIAHFMLQSMRRRAITVFGDGFQVRDALHISDAVAAWIGILDNIDTVTGKTFNLGGGPQNAVSLLELLGLIEQIRGERPEVRFGASRPGDQPWYISDIGAISSAIGWRPRVPFRKGLHTLQQWLERRFAGATLAIEREVA